EAIFQGNDFAKWNARFEESGIEPCDNDLILKRSLSLSGTNRQFINGSPTTLANLKALGDDLVDLHGPHDHQSLLSPDRQLDLLDAFAAAGDTREKFAKIFRSGRCDLVTAGRNTKAVARIGKVGSGDGDRGEYA